MGADIKGQEATSRLSRPSKTRLSKEDSLGARKARILGHQAEGYYKPLSIWCKKRKEDLAGFSRTEIENSVTCKKKKRRSRIENRRPLESPSCVKHDQNDLSVRGRIVSSPDEDLR